LVDRPWLALAPLLVACASLSPARAAAAGMCWTGAAAAGVAWFLPGMLSGYFALTTVSSWLATLAVAACLHGIYVSAYAAWVAWLVRRHAANPVLLAGGWLVCEFARSHGAVGSPWALAAYSQVRWTPMIQIADLAGPYGLGMLIAAVNAGAAASVAPALRGSRPRLAIAMIAAAVAGAGCYGQWRPANPSPTAPPYGSPWSRAAPRWSGTRRAPPGWRATCRSRPTAPRPEPA
jgi:apolipoprotein N-acyltransferase